MSASKEKLSGHNSGTDDANDDVPEIDQEILKALQNHKSSLDGSDIAAPHVSAISEQILQQASVRSQELQRPAQSNRLVVHERGASVPWWMLALLICAIGAFVAALLFVSQ